MSAGLTGPVWGSDRFTWEDLAGLVGKRVRSRSSGVGASNRVEKIDGHFRTVDVPWSVVVEGEVNGYRVDSESGVFLSIAGYGDVPADDVTVIEPRWWRRMFRG